MHWILQDNLFNESAYEELLATLERFELPYSIHKVIPFIGELVPEPELDHKNVICMGSYSLRHYAKKKIWAPGVFDLAPCTFEIQREKWGEEMLNYDSQVVKFKNAAVLDDAFIRPIEDSKVFAGKVFSAAEFHEWQEKVCVLNEDYGNSLTKDTFIQVVSPKLIHAEYRFWIVHGDIICASMYKLGQRVIYSDQVNEVVFDYVRDRIATWQPHAAFVIDVCETPDGMKIVEINTLNSSGFYACNIQKLVMALEEGFSR
jgi:hypothetical protein